MRTKYAIFPPSVFLLVTAFFITAFCFGQTVFLEKEKLINLPDGILKTEMVSFTLTGRSAYPGKKAVKLNTVRLCNVTDTAVFFDNACNILGFFSADIMVKIKSVLENGRRKISEVRFVRDTKRIYILSESAIRGLYEPNFYRKVGKKKVSDCKVFWSKDRKRFYIYMLNGSGENRYEVTWIIQDGILFKRIMDKVDKSGEAY